MIKKIFRGAGITLACAVIGIGIVYTGDALETKPDLSLSVFRNVRSHVPATVVAFAASEVGDGLEYRQVEGTNYIRLIPVVIEGRIYPSGALINEKCVIPPPGTQVTVEIATTNSDYGSIGFAHGDRPDTLISLECPY